MISEITIANFKSYRQATLPLAPLTLLVGANASGKSNAIEAIRFLSWLAHGRRLDDILEKVQQTDIAIRGTLRDLTYDQAAEPIITLGCALTNTDEWQQLQIAIKVTIDGEPRVVAESIRSISSTVPLYEIKHSAEAHSREVQVAYNNFARGGKKPTIPCTDRQAIFTQLEIPSRFNEGPARKIIPDVTSKFQNSLQQILFLDPNPRQMSGYSFMVDRELRGDGANLSSVLYDLCKAKRQKDDVLLFIRALPEQDIVDIDFIKTPRSEVMVQLTESFGGQKTRRDAPLLSDGTLRVLAVAAALLSAAKGSLVIIEEIDNGVHPSRAGLLLQNIQRVALQRGLRVLLTSHNPALLDALPAAAIPNVVFCYRVPDTGESCLVRLEELGDYPELVARGPLGELLTDGVIDRFVKQQRSPTQKQRDALDWLELLHQQVEAEYV
ncbi:MAG: ATP-binding protein [Caldilinea sp. CFX5]|nr:ATP-binding protein [Caldilinea sp. CFX5]